MANRQAPSKARFADPPPEYDQQYLRQMLDQLETRIQRIESPISSQFVVTNTQGAAFRSIDINACTLEQLAYFVGEMAKAFVDNNKLSSQVRV